MSLEDFRNPAYRLRRFLEFADSEDYSDNDPLRLLVSDYFDLDNDEQGSTYDPRMMRCIAELLELPGEIETAVAARPVQIPPDELVLRPLARVEPALRHLAGVGQHSVGTFRKGYTESDMNDLQHCIYYIAGVPGEVVSSDRLIELRRMTDELIELVESAGDDLDAFVRKFVYDQAIKIREAVRLARAAGNELLDTTLNEALGQLIRSGPTVVALEKNRTVHDKFWNVMNRLLIVSQLGSMAMGLPAAVSELLPIENPPSMEAPDTPDAEQDRA